MPNKTINSPTQDLYLKIFGELPKRDIVDADMPTLYAVLETITDRERTTITMRFGLGCEKMTKVAIGKSFNVTTARITQIEAKAIRKLQHESRAGKIKPLFYTYEEMRAEIARRDEQINDLRNDLSLARRENTELRERNRELGENPADARTFPNLQLTEILDSEIEQMDLSVRSYNGLKRASLRTVRDVVLRFNQDGLVKARLMGKRSIEEVASKLTEWGIPLGHPAEYYL